jgi:hypothetical protein
MPGLTMRLAASSALALSVLATGQLLSQDAMFRGGPAHLGVFDSPPPSLR